MESVIVIAPERMSRRDVEIAPLQKTGLLPVAVPTVDAAVTLLRHDSVAATVLHADARPLEWNECGVLIATGTPVVFVAIQESAEVP